MVKASLHGYRSVSRTMDSPVELDELMLELSRVAHEDNVGQAKLHSAAEAETLTRQWKARGLSVGFTNGCFDIVHPGHVTLLAKARVECDRLIVALNSDASVSRLKGPQRPINTLADRAAVIGALAVSLVQLAPHAAPDVFTWRSQPTV